MLTEERIQELRAKLAQEVKDAANRGEFDRLGPLSQAVGLIDNRRPDTDRALLAAELEKLLGSKLREEIPAPAAAFKPEPVPTPAPEPIAPIAEVPKEPLPLPLSGQPASEPKPAVSPEVQETLQPLLDEVRRARAEDPDLQQLVDLASRLERVGDTLQALVPDSKEASAALQDARLARDLQGLLDDIQNCVQQTEGAKAHSDYRQAGQALVRAKGLQSQLDDSRFDRFTTASKALRERAKRLAEDAEAAKRAVGAVAVEPVTMVRDQRFEEALDKLDDMMRKGVPSVLTEAGEEVATTEYNASVRRQFLEFCREKATDRLNGAQQYLDDDEDRLDEAEIQCNAALDFVHKERVRADMEKEQVAWDLASLQEKIIRQKELRNTAQHQLDLALGLDPAVALDILDQIQYKKLRGLKEAKASQIGRLERELKAVTDTDVAQSLVLRRERKYTEAQGALSHARERLRKSPQVGLNLASLHKQLDNEEQAIEQEQVAWVFFKGRLDDALERIKQGQVDEQARREIEKQFSEQDRQTFRGEWDDLQDRMARQVGDHAIYGAAVGKDLTDESIVTLLKDIGSGSSLYGDAQRLLRRHYAHAALARARQKLADYPSLMQNPNRWLAGIDDEAQRVQANAARPDDAPIVTEAQELRATAAQLHAWYVEVKNLPKDKEGWPKGETAWTKLQAYTQAAKGEPYLANGLRWLENDLRRQLRALRMAFINTRVLEQGSPAVGDVRQAAAYIEELEEHSALIEDGDGLIADQIHRTWHQGEVDAILGMPLEKADGETIAALGKQRDVDWQGLLEHLEALARHSFGYSGTTQRTAEQLRMVALGYHALNLPRQEGINRLEEERSKETGLRDHPIICATMVLRYLEQPDGRQSAGQVTNELQGRGRAAQTLAEALEKVIQAHEMHSDGDLEMAIATLEAGAGSINELVPEFGPGLMEAVEHTAGHWRRDLGEESLRQGLQETPTAEGLAAFKILRKLRQAEKLLPGDVRVKAGIQRLRQMAQRVRRDLHEEVEDLLDHPPDRLEDAINQGEELKDYLEEIIGEEAQKERGGRRRTDDNLFNELAQNYGNLCEELENWELVWRNVREARLKLRRLLEGEWYWNSEPRQTPMRDLREVRSMLDGARDVLGEYEPLETKGILNLIMNLERAVQDISQPFESFRRSFDETSYRNEQDFRQARDLLDTLQQKFGHWEASLGNDVSALGRDRPAINLGRFFRVRDVYGRARQLEDGRWVPGTAEDVRSVVEARTRLGERQRNWQAWQKQSEEMIQTLQDLQGNLQNARNHLRRGYLGRATKLCEDEIPSALQKLDNLCRRIPEPPLCELALRAAHNTGDFEANLDSDTEVQQARERLRSAQRVEMPTTWKEYLKLEIEAARRQLGPSAEGQQERETLVDTCMARKKQLQELCRQMAQHIRLTRDSKATRSSQELLYGWLQNAAAIDQEDPEVKGYQSQYESRQRKLGLARQS